MTGATDSKSEFDAAGSGQYWDEWNREWRFRQRPDEFMQRQLAAAVAAARAARLENARILGIGCGTGWLEEGLLTFGEIWGTDLSDAAIEEGKRRHPRVNLRCCDFLSAELPGPFDMIVSADSLVPMADHARCMQRVAQLLRPGGTFLLMTQNPGIWARRTAHRRVSDSVPHADPSEWPNTRRLRELLRLEFEVDSVTTIDPGGDMGMLWWVENAFVKGLMGAVIGAYRWRRVLELAGLGREIIVIARRR